MTGGVAASRLNDCLQAIQNERRRDVLASLSETASLPVAALADGDDRDRVALVHCHLPMLDAAGYVDWDPDRGRLERGPRFTEASTLLELVQTHEDEFPWTVE